MNTPRRVAFCITDLDPGGAERALYEIVTRLDRTKFEPHVFSLSGGAVAQWLKEREIPVTCFDLANRSRYQVLGWLTRELRGLRPDIVQGFLFHGNLVSRIAAWRAGVPIRLAGHRVAEREKTWHLWLDRLTKSLVKKHVCVSEGVAEHLRRHLAIDDSQTVVIPNGIDPNTKVANDHRLHEQLGLPDGCRIVIAVGRLQRQKGFDLLIDAFQDVSRRWNDVHLAIVGEGPERAVLERQIESLHCSSSVTLLGYRTDVPELIAEADVFVLSSRWEGMPNVVMQAMLNGTPVVATRVEGITELIEQGRSGLVVELNQAGPLASAIIRILADAEFAKQVADHAQRVIETHFTWEQSAQMYETLFSELLN